MTKDSRRGRARGGGSGRGDGGGRRGARAGGGTTDSTAAADTTGAPGSGVREFEIVREFEVGSPPQQVWDAFATVTGTSGWLWPMEYEPRVGGAAPHGAVVTAWDPPRRLTVRSDGPAVLFAERSTNHLEHLIEPRDGGRRSWVRHAHSGIFTQDWGNQYDAADKHTDFYLHTLREYLTYFAGRPVTYTHLDAPAATTAHDAFTRLALELGLPTDASEGARFRLSAAGADLDAVLDFRTPYFIGLRTDDALYRFFGRNHFGRRIGVSVHDFAAGADAKSAEPAWRDWLTRLYG
ncbi:SRPBCC family protein [Streptomyces flavofungini]|uniref:SRPBCC family protein n=1 Tax=Streptomyces flavofungini TaxID=68200 RepID=UPI0025AEE643|nr:SRPBCC domain-containing protein [Streptomyces flavofungini]WJV49525.1 SRPBCC domain-containing protein [Streptomyces flavofungini]